MNNSMKSLENQNKEIKYLKETVLTMHKQTSRQKDDLYKILGAVATCALDNITYYQTVISDLSENHEFKGTDRKHVNELLAIVSSVPAEIIQSAKKKFADLQQKIEMRERNSFYTEEQPSTSKGPKSSERDEQPKKLPNTQNLKKNAQKRKKKAQANESFSNNEHDAYNMKISLPSTSKASEQDLEEVKFPIGENLKKKAQKRKKKAQANEWGSNSGNGAHNKKVSLPNSSKIAEHGLEEIQPSEQNIMKKTQTDKKKETQANNEKSMKNSKATKKMPDSNNEMNEFKELVVLTDFMIDPSADENPYIAKYKREHFHAKNDEEADHLNVGEKFKKKLSK